MDILEKIFGSVGKVKLMRLFLFNPNAAYSVTAISEKIQMRPAAVRSELSNLEKIDFIKRRTQTEKKTEKKHKSKSGSAQKSSEKVVFFLNEKFPFINQLGILLINTAELLRGNLQKRIVKTGKIKLLIISGLFIQNSESRVDLLIVGDGIRKRTLFNTIKTIESEIGKEIRYAAFESHDFTYRLSVYDKLVRDIIDFPHERLIDKMGVK